jgi:DNA-binding HxlR family transcriptional regulator
MRESYGCPVELALDVLGGKWRAVILAHIKEGAHRYADLRDRIPRISEKMLTQRLRELSADGLIERRASGYVLTRRGERSREVLDALYGWGLELANEREIRVGLNSATYASRHRKGSAS